MRDASSAAMATSSLSSSMSDPSRLAVSGRLPYPPDPRAFDFSFAFNNPDFSDRVLVLEILEDGEHDTSTEKDPMHRTKSRHASTGDPVSGGVDGAGGGAGGGGDGELPSCRAPALPLEVQNHSASQAQGESQQQQRRQQQQRQQQQQPPQDQHQQPQRHHQQELQLHEQDQQQQQQQHQELLREQGPRQLQNGPQPLSRDPQALHLPEKVGMPQQHQHHQQQLQQHLLGQAPTDRSGAWAGALHAGSTQPQGGALTSIQARGTSSGATTTLDALYPAAGGVPQSPRGSKPQETDDEDDKVNSMEPRKTANALKPSEQGTSSRAFRTEHLDAGSKLPTVQEDIGADADGAGAEGVPMGAPRGSPFRGTGTGDAPQGGPQVTIHVYGPASPSERPRRRRSELHVISAILVSQSEFFRSLFSPQWSTLPGPGDGRRPPPVTLTLQSDEEKPFLDLMRFIYTGRLGMSAGMGVSARVEEEEPLDPEALLQLLLVANKFGVLSCVNVCAHHLREVPLSLDMCCVLLRVCSGVMLSEAASFLVASSAAFLVQRFGSLDTAWQTQEFLDLPLEALEAILGSDDVAVTSEETIFSALLHWVRHRYPDDLAARKELVARLAEKVRFPAMDAEALRVAVMNAPEADAPKIQALVMDALWFKCSSFERQQELVLSSIRQHRRYVRRRQLSIHSEVLLQDCHMLQPAQAILLSGGAWVCGKLFSLKVMRVAAPVGGSDFGLFLQASQRCPTQDKVLDDSVSVEFSFKVKEWPAGVYVQQKQSASHTFKGLFRERGYRSLLNPWNEIMKDNNKYFRNGVMYIRADLRVIHGGESLALFE